MATVSTEVADLDGVQLVDTAASGGGDKVSPGSVVLVLNAGGSPINCTITTPGDVEGLAVADQVVVCANHATRRTAFSVPARLYRNPSDGLVSLAWSAVTSVSFAVTRGMAE